MATGYFIKCCLGQFKNSNMCIQICVWAFCRHSQLFVHLFSKVLRNITVMLVWMLRLSCHICQKFSGMFRLTVTSDKTNSFCSLSYTANQFLITLVLCFMYTCKVVNKLCPLWKCRCRQSLQLLAINVLSEDLVF